MSTVVITIRGDQIATYTNFSGMGNNQDREVTVNGIQTLGTASQEFTITFNQINGGATQFQNGQRITITDSDGNVILTGIKQFLTLVLTLMQNKALLPEMNI